MNTSTMSIQHDQLEIIQMVSTLEDSNLVKRIKKYVQKVTAPKTDPLYAPSNIAAIEQGLEEYREGKTTRMTRQELHDFLWA